MLWGSQVRGCVEAPLSAFRGVDKELQVPEWRSTQTRNWSDSWRKRRRLVGSDSWWQLEIWGEEVSVKAAEIRRSPDTKWQVPIWGRLTDWQQQLQTDMEQRSTSHRVGGGGATVFIRTNNTINKTGRAPADGVCPWALGQTCYVIPPSRLLFLPNWSLFSRSALFRKILKAII